MAKVLRNSDGTKLTATETKEQVLAFVRQGLSSAEAIRRLGKSEKTLDYYRRSDPEWYEKLKLARSRVSQAEEAGEPTRGTVEVPDFPEFCEQYLGMRLYRHQLQWFDLMEGREPRDLHPAQVYVPGRPDMVIVNTPPEHAKSTTLSVNYSVWRLCKDPNTLIAIVSKTQVKAKEFLYSVKNRLTHPRFRKLQQDFGPVDGFDKNSGGWTQTHIYLSDDTRDTDEKDPNVQALGIGGHIYGTRSAIIVLDDCIDGTNVKHYAEQIQWVSGEVVSRLGRTGRIMVVGTRIEAVDFYKELRNGDYYASGKNPWTYLSQPAVLEYADQPEGWVTLWPKSNRPAQGDIEARQDENGEYDMWDGLALEKKRDSMTARKWALMYMQQEIQEDATFSLEAIRGCTNGNRTAGPLQAGNPYHRQQGMAGLHIIAGLDPAVTKDTAAIVVGLDRESGRRYVLDVFAAPTKPDEIFDLIRNWTERYRIVEWRVESNAMNLMITQNAAINSFLNVRGAILAEHYTSKNKWDADFGVASCASLFEGWSRIPAEHRALIELPSPHNHLGTRKLVDQLSIWHPGLDPKVTPCDTVMALWFIEIRCRELINTMFNQSHWENEWLTRADREAQIVIELDELEHEF